MRITTVARHSVALAATLGCLAGSWRASADDVYWVSGVNGNWSDGNKWSSGSPPGVSDHARIEADGTYSVTLDVDVVAVSVTVGAASGQQIWLRTAGSRCSWMGRFSRMACCA